MKSLYTLLFFCLCYGSGLSLDYYWVGGSGNWSDLSHWVTTSGGTIQHDQIPTAEDNVIFDTASFLNPGNQITLDLDNVFTRNLDFREINQDLVLMGPAETSINIFGSLYFHEDVQLDFPGSFNFRGEGGAYEISFNGQVPFQMRFLSEGDWTLKTDVTVDSLIRVQFGKLAFDDVQVVCQRFEVFSNVAVDIDFGNVNMEITGNRFLLMPSYQWRESLHFQGLTRTIAGNSTILLSGSKSTIGIYETDAIHLGEVTLGQPGGMHLVAANWLGNFTFQKLHLRGDTRLEGGFEMTELELDGGNIYSLQSNFSQKIGILSTNTDCSMVSQIRATEGGQAANLIATQGAQTVEYVLLQDLMVQGATYTANQAVDLGGNSGWTINEKNTDVFYWIGGTGNWNDINHWSFSSGGPPSGCIPTAADDVFFDQNSFTGPGQRVIINVPSAFCHTMDWRMVNQNAVLEHLTGRPNLSLHIFGSLYFSPMVTNAFDGDVFFESPHGDNEIQSADQEYVKNVYFASGSGAWSLIDEMDVNDTLFLNAGSLHTNDQELECFDFYSETNSVRSLTLGNSIFRIVPSSQNMYLGSNFRINATNFTIDPGQSTLLAEHTIYMYFYTPGTIDFYRAIFQGHSSIHVEEPTTTFKYAYHHHDGEFRGILNVDTLTFSPAKAYWLFMNSQINVDSMSAHGSCDGAIYIAGYPKGIKGTISKNSGELRVTNTMLEGVVGSGGANFIAEASQDLGLNENWTFMDATPRTLYWVGDAGDWFDRAHWSLSSGGPGGECVPTAIDDVIVDGNSFSGMYQSIGLTASNGPICHDLTWQGAPMSTGIYDGVINITGSLDLQPNLEWYPWNTTFRSDSTGNEIRSGGNELQWVDIMGAGSWTLMDDTYIPYQINIWQGTFNTNDFQLTTGHLHMGNYPVDFAKKVILGSSHVLLIPMPIWNDQLYINTNNFEFDPGTSLVEFSGAFSAIKHFGNGELLLNNVLFSNTAGQSRIEEYDEAHFKFKKLEFYNSGYILGNNEMDTLLLAAGKVYELEANKTQRVYNHLRAIGNNCTPIGLVSTEPGVRSTIWSEEAVVIGDFIQMQDQLATGGTHFSAGAHSTDISNNQGWIFEDDPDFIEVGFLGEDVTLCQANALTLSAFNFSPQEAYVWSTASTDSTIEVTAGGEYWAEVTFNDNCVIRDSIKVLDPLMVNLDLGADAVLCEGEEITLDGSIDFPKVEYQWQDGTTSADYLVSEQGFYKLEATIDGCTFADSIDVAYVALPSFNLEGTQKCEGDTILLDATVPGGTYAWSDGFTGATREILVDGQYAITVEANGCTASDSLEIQFTPLPPLDLGSDSTLCEGEVWRQDLVLVNADYLWNDGSTSSQFEIRESGSYWVALTQNQCTSRDTINVTFQPLPQLMEQPDTTLCIGTSWSIELDEDNVAYTWNDQTISGDVQITEPGLQRIGAMLNGCTKEISFDIDFEPPPNVTLGGDISLCDGEAQTLSLNESNVRYQWSDGHQGNELVITAAGNYWVTGYKHNCSASDTVLAQFQPLPVFSLGEDLDLCPGTSFELRPDNVGDSQFWQDGSNQTVFAGDSPGVYWLDIEENSCHFRDTILVSYRPTIPVDLGPDTLVCDDKDFYLDAMDPGAASYLWQDGSNLPQLLTRDPGMYHVEVSDGQCVFSDSVFVDFRECFYFYSFVPNAFSPNGDGVNDYFYPELNPAVAISDFQFSIFDRWGNLIFQSEEIDARWDGRFNGENMTPGVYIYDLRMRYQDDDGQGSFEKAGDVTVIE